MLRSLLIMLVMTLSIMVVGCEPDTPGERIADSMEDVSDEVRDSAEDIGNEMEDACEELKQEAGAADSNC